MGGPVHALIQTDSLPRFDLLQVVAAPGPPFPSSFRGATTLRERPLPYVPHPTASLQAATSRPACTKMYYYVDMYTNSIPRERRHVTS